MQPQRVHWIIPLAVLLAGTFWAASVGAQEFSYVFEWGTSGAGPGQFEYPAGVATHLNRVYVTERSNHRVQVFDAWGAWVAGWGSYGSGPGSFNSPTGIAVDGNGLVYVADYYNYRVQVFDGYGGYSGCWGSYGTGNGQFRGPSGVAVDAYGQVYVSDQVNNCIQVFSNGGTFLNKWGSVGSGDGQFNAPSGLAVGPSDILYVADWGNHRVQMFTLDGSYMGQWGAYGSGPGSFKNPFGVAVMDYYGLYSLVLVSDSNNGRIQGFDASGGFHFAYGAYGSGAGQFRGPRGLACNDWWVYVADQGNDRIQVVGELPVPVKSTTWGRVKALYR